MLCLEVGRGQEQGCQRFLGTKQCGDHGRKLFVYRVCSSQQELLEESIDGGGQGIGTGSLGDRGSLGRGHGGQSDQTGFVQSSTGIVTTTTVSVILLCRLETFVYQELTFFGGGQMVQFDQTGARLEAFAKGGRGWNNSIVMLVGCGGGSTNGDFGKGYWRWMTFGSLWL